MMTFMQSDRAVMRRVLGGNLGAFRTLVDRYGGVVQSVAYARLRNRADAEDIAQETFIRLYQQLDQMAHRKRIGPWLVRVARNVSVDLVRKRGREEALAERQEDEPVEAPNPSRKELHRILWEQLEGMDGDAREVLILYYFMRKRAKEIAALLEISPEAAAKRVQRARDELGRRLTDYLGDELDEVRADSRRRARIMAAVLAAPAAWKASAAAGAAATAAGVATGAAVAKVAGLAAILTAVCLIGYMALQQGEQTSPPSPSPPPPDVTASSTITIEEPAPANLPEEAPGARAVGEQGAVAAGDEGEDSMYAPIYGTLTGTISFEDGTPAAGADVWIDNEQAVQQTRWAARDGAERKVLEPLRFETRADADGRYFFSGLPLVRKDGMGPGLTLFAGKEGFSACCPLSSNLAERERIQDLMLHPSLALGGVVTDERGTPVPDAFVQLQMEDPRYNQYAPYFFGTNSNTAISDHNGQFLLEHLPLGRCNLQVNAAGFLHYESEWLPTGGTDYVLALDRGNSISGRVVNVENGEPVPDVQLNGERERHGGNPNPNRSFYGHTDSRGRFAITGCVPGTYRLYAGGDFGEPFPLRLVEPMKLKLGAEPLTGLEIKLAPGAVLYGSVFDESGAPFEGDGGVCASFEGGYRSSEITKDGAYRLEGLAADKINVSANCTKGNGQRLQYQGHVDLQSKEVEKRHDIRLESQPGLAGTVVNERGEPVPWASVCAIVAPEPESHSQPMFLVSDLADDAGRFFLNIMMSPQPEKLHLQAFSDNALSVPSGPFTTDVTHAGIVLTVLPSGRLEGEVVTRGGRPFDRGKINAVPLGAGAADAGAADDVVVLTSLSSRAGSTAMKPPAVKQLSKDGRFLYPQLLPGQYKLEIHSDRHSVSGPIAMARVNVQAGRKTRARLVVDAREYGGVEGYILAGGRPAPGVHVYVGDASTVADQNGWYSLADLEAGDHTLTVIPDAANEGNRRQMTFTVVAGEVARVDFDLAGHTGAIEGYVTLNGRPDPDVRVVASNAESSPPLDLTARTDLQGFYLLDSAPDGRYEMLADRDGGLIQSAFATVTDGETARADFEFRAGSISGTITGLQQAEKAWMWIFPAEVCPNEWTAETLEYVREHSVEDGQIEPADMGQSWTIGPFEEGDYMGLAVVLPAEKKFSAEAALEGRMVLTDVLHVTVDGTAEVALDLK